MKKMEAVVLAGGKGTRLASVVKDVPKPMAPVAGRPFLQYVMDELLAQGVRRVVLAVCYKKESIMDFFGTEYQGMEIAYSVEDTPLFTGGGIRKALTLCFENRVFVVNGDTFFSVDFRDMQRFSEQGGYEMAIAVREMERFSRYGTLSFNETHEITAFHEKQYCERGYINGGIYNLKRNALEPYPVAFSLEEDCFPRLVDNHALAAFPAQGLFIDIGIPEDYARAQEIFGEKTC